MFSASSTGAVTAPSAARAGSFKAPGDSLASATKTTPSTSSSAWAMVAAMNSPSFPRGAWSPGVST